MKPTTRLVFASLLVTAVLGAGCDENILDPMADRQPRAMRYKESDFWQDGLTMHAPPPGTVPRERILQKPVLTTGLQGLGPIQPNGEPLPQYSNTIPIPVTRELLALGRKRFDITCATCHGPLGDGDSIVARQMSLRPPPTLHKYVDKPSGYFFEVITKGFGMMASYSAELSVEERWAIVAYLRALQLSQATPVSELPPDVRRQLDAQPPQPAGGGHP
jgi:mono/diheme cytochrome c family protein